MDDFTDSLARLRKERGLTQAQLADAAGINQATISKIERGEANPTLSMLRKITEALAADDEITEFLGQVKTDADDSPREWSEWTSATEWNVSTHDVQMECIDGIHRVRTRPRKPAEPRQWWVECNAGTIVTSTLHTGPGQFINCRRGNEVIRVREVLE
ncbi:MAG: helix-turn-helix transcriptional regulator [Vannielia sp.]|uniref:helix-turn-helix domain-containing protein n=1 Tax=Vannielia sp. TaxID=2813045 RepID=UPI003B8AB8D4